MTIETAEAADGKLVSSVAKSPPVERQSDVNQRRWVMASFWAVVLFVGLPIWFATTSIYRAALPLDLMHAWSEGKVCRPTFPIHIALDAPHLALSDASQLVQLIQHTLDDQHEASPHHLRLHLADSMRSEKPNDHGQSIGSPVPASQTHAARNTLILRLASDANTASFTSTSQLEESLVTVRYPATELPTPLTAASSSPLTNYVVTVLHEIFREEQAIIQHTLTTSTISSVKPNYRQAIHEQLGAKMALRQRQTLKSASTYHLTISLFTATSAPSQWDIEVAVSNYLSPLLHVLSGLSNFTIDTQVQVHAAFAPSFPAPSFDDGRQAWKMRKEELSNFINAAEWPLGPGIGAAPTLNFIIYVPDPANSPLIVADSNTSTWLIPQWGGITILNLSEDPLPAHLTHEQLRIPFLSISHHLLSLLGLPSGPTESLAFRLDSLVRINIASLMLSAASTLGSLARLTKALPSIAIPVSVATAVANTIGQLDDACSDLKQGDFSSALEHARLAEYEAERGFFEKSMVGQAYFPEEHKVAVYLPLLGPIGVPLIMSALKELRSWKEGRR